MSTESDQRRTTLELVVALKDVDRRLRTAKKNVRLLQSLHDRITEALKLRAERALRLEEAKR